MKELLRQEVSRQALLLSGIASLMAMPQILRFAENPAAIVLLLTCVIGLWAMSGFILAWSEHGGMNGAFPSVKKQAMGALLALLLGAVSIPAGYFLEPVVREAAATGPHAASAFLQFPETVAELLAVMLWTAGFETLFLIAGVASLIARVSGKFWIAILAVVVIRVWITYSKAGGDETGALLALLCFRAAGSMIGAWVFGRFGLIPCAVYGAATCLRHLPLPEADG